MERKILHIILLLVLVLVSSCSTEHFDVVEEESQYMKISLRSGEDAGSDSPCFIFWRQVDYMNSLFPANPFTPYVYSVPNGVIDDYKDPRPKYNTGYVYPPYSEWVYAVGVSPSKIVPNGNVDWKTFFVSPDLAGVTDIQSAPVITGSDQTNFSDPLVFAHQLTKLEFSGYCGSSMKIVEANGTTKYVNVTDIQITLKADSAAQWKWFPEKLEWNHGSGPDGQYKVKAYAAAPALGTIKAKISINDVLTIDNTSATNPKPIGNFYLVPGFDSVIIEVEVKYVDSTIDGTSPSGNGQEIIRIWEKIAINDIYPESGGGTTTSAGESYSIKLMFDRSKIVLGVTLEDWDPDEIHN